jgi:acyl carrier protein
MTAEELLALVATGMAHVTGHPAPALTLDADIDTLGLDSLQTLELVAWAEERLSVRVPDEELARVGSIGDLSAAWRHNYRPARFRSARHDEPGPA